MLSNQLGQASCRSTEDPQTQFLHLRLPDLLYPQLPGVEQLFHEEARATWPLKAPALQPLVLCTPNLFQKQ